METLEKKNQFHLEQVFLTQFHHYPLYQLQKVGFTYGQDTWLCRVVTKEGRSICEKYSHSPEKAKELAIEDALLALNPNVIKL